jgi:hypothetical protein
MLIPFCISPHPTLRFRDDDAARSERSHLAPVCSDVTQHSAMRRIGVPGTNSRLDTAVRADHRISHFGGHEMLDIGPIEQVADCSSPARPPSAIASWLQ